MSRPVLAIDVDITTLASDELWWKWLKSMTCIDTLQIHDCYVRNLLTLHAVEREYGDGQTRYDLSSYFPNMKNSRVNGYSFWRSENIYDFVEPVVRAVPAITSLAEHFDIVFVTHCKGNHSRSKYNCLERHFGHIPFDYVVTKEKHRVDADLLIDDRNEFINQFLTSNRCAVKLLTPYTQSESLIDTDNLPIRSVYKEAKDWDEIVEHVYEIFPF